jgi:hypothetical protein
MIPQTRRTTSSRHPEWMRLTSLIHSCMPLQIVRPARIRAAKRFNEARAKRQMNSGFRKPMNATVQFVLQLRKCIPLPSLSLLSRKYRNLRISHTALREGLIAVANSITLKSDITVT